MGYLWLARSLGSLGCAAKARVGLRQFKGGAKKHKKQEQIYPYQPPNDVERNLKAWKPTIHEQGADTSKNPWRRTMKGSGWENFNLAGRNKLTWEKWQRERQPKAESENVKFRSPKGRRTKGQLSRDTLKWKLSKRHLGKKHQKKKIMRNEEGSSHQCCWHNIGSDTQRSKWGESVVHREP